MNSATKPTITEVKSMIEEVTYTRLPSGTAIVCEMTLTGLHPVHGIAAVVDMENYDNDQGCKAAYSRALDKAFEVLAYTLHQRMHRGNIPSKHAELVATYKFDSNGQPVAVEPTFTKKGNGNDEI